MQFPVLDPVATGARIKELRKEHNLKVCEVAAFMGFESEQAIYKWQRGDSLPTVDNLYALSRLFDTSVDDILRGDKERDDDPSLFNCFAVPLGRNSVDCSFCSLSIDKMLYYWFIFFVRVMLYTSSCNSKTLRNSRS